MQPLMQAETGVPIIVENRPGAAVGSPKREGMGCDPAAFDARMKSDRQRWANLIRTKEVKLTE